MKIDLHLHLSRKQMPQSPFGWVSTAEQMIPRMAELGIEKGVLMSGGERGRDWGTNEENRKIAELYPDRYAWMCNLDAEDIGTVYRRLKICRDQGAVGIGELMVNRRLDDLFLETVFDAAGRLGLPVTFHMSPEAGTGYGVADDPGLPLLERALRRFPDTVFLGHSQPFWIEISGDAPSDKAGRNSWGKGPVVPGGRILELFDRYPNLYGDLSANSGGCAIMRDEAFGLAFLERYADRLFFATDMVNTEMEFPLGKWLDMQVSSGKLSRQAYEKICRKNAERVFGLGKENLYA